jgi:acylphosphatase
MTVARYIVARGRVQGVGYRAFVADEAARRGIAGWVRNRRDGTVEAVFEGPPDAVEAVIAACRIGPWGARVDAVEVRGASPEERAIRPAEARFAVLATA